MRWRSCATCTTCRSRVSLAQLVRATLERTRLVEIALAGWDGAAVGREPRQARRPGARLQRVWGGGLRAFARWLAEQRGGIGRGRGERQPRRPTTSSA